MLAISAVVFFAGWDGIIIAFDMNKVIALIIALILLEFPIILAIAALYGAVNAWGWPIWGAILLVMWPLVFTIIMNGVLSIFSLFGLSRLKNQ
ncbi:hypothetical protein [Orbus mooreae]|uniref:hypothetical protein n=1 Tax=Orbus mooreae TaxID=3074107 RepID=UPI00370D20A7